MVFGAGVACGSIVTAWLLPTGEPAGGGAAASSSGAEPGSAGSPAGATERRGAGERGAAAGGLDAGFAERLRAARGGPAGAAPGETAEPEGVATTRIREWLAASGLDAAERVAATDELRKHEAAGGGDPLAEGSDFDRAMGEMLSGGDTTSWAALRESHRADVVERRTYQILGGLQAELSLSPGEKDAVFEALSTRLVPEEFPVLAGGEPPDEATRERWTEERYEALAPLVPEARRERLAEWLEEFLPGYWDAAAEGR